MGKLLPQECLGCCFRPACRFCPVGLVGKAAASCWSWLQDGTPLVSKNLLNPIMLPSCDLRCMDNCFNSPVPLLLLSEPTICDLNGNTVVHAVRTGLLSTSHRKTCQHGGGSRGANGKLLSNDKRQGDVREAVTLCTAWHKEDA